MEFVAVSAAIMLLEIPFTIPAFILAVRGKALGVAACLAGFATFAYVIFWMQVYAEMTAKSASVGRGSDRERDPPHSPLNQTVPIVPAIAGGYVHETPFDRQRHCSPSPRR